MNSGSRTCRSHDKPAIRRSLGLPYVLKQVISEVLGKIVVLQKLGLLRMLEGKRRKNFESSWRSTVSWGSKGKVRVPVEALGYLVKA